ncbi:MAG TPA: tetratricopeptide repeat protein [Polyangia bacterium]
MLRSKLSPRTGWLRMVLVVRSLLKNPLALAVAAGLAVTTVGCGHAEDEAIAEMERLQKSAIASLKKGKPQEARRDLLEAVRVGNEAGLEDEPVMANAHLALGSVYVTLKQPKRATAHLNAAIERNPEIALKGTLATPAAKKALAAVRAGEKLGPTKTAAPKPAAPASAPAVAEAPATKPETTEPAPAAAAPAPAPAAAAPAAPATARPAPAPPAAPQIAAVAAPPRDPLTCRVPDEAPPEYEVFFRCSVRPDVKITRLLLHYRPAGQELFKEVTMSRNKRGGYTGAIPAEATNGKSLQYFIEGRGPTKIENGNADSPNLILVREGAAPATRTDPFPGKGISTDEDDEDRRSSENEDPLAEIARERELERDREGAHRRLGGNFFAGFGLGSGYGWQKGGSLEFRTEKSVAAGPLSGGLIALRPEVGYQLTDDLAVSIQARLQFIPAQGSGDGTPGSPIESAHSILLRATQAFGNGNFRPTGSVVVGGGQGFRLRVPRDPDANLARSDTVRGGPLLVGGGGGFTYHATEHVAWTLELRLLAGLPSIALLGEMAAGVEVGF